MKTYKKTILLLLIVLSFLTCADKIPKWEQKINAQIEFQKEIAVLLLREAPDLKELIIINRDLQITMYEMKREQYKYLISHYPGRIEPDRDLNFEWTEEDENNLLQSSRNYASLKDEKEKLYAKNQGHPMWPALREIFAKVKETKKFKEEQNELMEIIGR